MGHLAISIAKQNPHLTGLVCDLEACKAPCEDNIKLQNMEGRVSFQTIDFFTEDFPKTDVIVFSLCILNWAMEDKKKLIKRSFDGLNAGGHFIIVEPVLGEEKGEHERAACHSLNMVFI